MSMNKDANNSAPPPYTYNQAPIVVTAQPVQPNYYNGQIIQQQPNAYNVMQQGYVVQGYPQQQQPQYYNNQQQTYVKQPDRGMDGFSFCCILFWAGPVFSYCCWGSYSEEQRNTLKIYTFIWLVLIIILSVT